MTITTRRDDNDTNSLLAIARRCAGARPAPAQAQVSDGVIKIGVLTDMSASTPTWRAQARSSRRRWRSRISASSKRGYKVEIISADHQNKPDVGSAIARQWYDVDGST